MPELRSEVGLLAPKLEKVIHTLEWVRIEEFIGSTWRGCGWPNIERDAGECICVESSIGLPLAPQTVNIL